MNNNNIDNLDLCTYDNLDFFNFNGRVFEAKVLKCYDGDTIYCAFLFDGKYQKFKIRMFGYDSPEMRPKKTIEESVRIEIKKKAMEAKLRIEELILNKRVYLFCKEFEKYGRILCDVKINMDDNITINQIMINENHGYEYYGKTKKKYREKK